MYIPYAFCTFISYHTTLLLAALSLLGHLEKLTDHEEPESVVEFFYVISICRHNSKGWSQDRTITGVEQTLPRVSQHSLAAE